MKHLLFIAFTCILLSCNKKGETAPVVATPPIIVETQPTQYGTPFTGVPDKQDAIIYQVNIRCFSSGGNLAGILSRLDSIKALGVNTIYLMPIHPVGSINSVNSPYCIKDYKAVNTEFGTLADLRAVTDAAHSKNMCVLMDWVANHTSWDNPWITSNKDWYLQNAAGNVVSPPGMGWNDVAQLNFTNATMRLEMIKAMKYWVYTANIDGYRCDYTDGPPVDFWKQAIDTLRNITSHKLLLLAEGSRTSNFSAGFDFNFGFGFYDQIKTIFGSNGSALLINNVNTSEYNGSANNQQVVRYITNHDVNGSDGTPLDLFGGKKGSMAAFVVAATMKSVPMIYNGQEVGTPFRITFPFVSQKINWTLNPDVTAEYKKVIAIRNNNAAIRRGTLTTYSNADICTFTKDITGEKVLVIANLRNSTINYSIPIGLANSTWVDLVNGGNITLTTQITLQPYNYLILKQ